MKSRSVRPLLHVFSTLLLVAAVLTGTWQQNQIFRHQADETPPVPFERVLARGETGARASQSGQNKTDRPCPRLLHLDATLASEPVARRCASRATPMETAVLLPPEEHDLSVATPPPRG